MNAIKVENLGKKYIIRHQQQQRSNYLSLRDEMVRWFKRTGKRIIKPNMPRPSKEEFWALKDISFEIKQGERVGIIGRNGAGKSTLLKLLSRITVPTTGKIKIKGRVSSLLEVGTGFHPELTGRENIYLNGAIMGMPRAEIKKKFDEIVDFSGVEKFLDTPVKRFSSGMYVRLAFAVAAHLEPDILLVDEVLAVGDAEFQKKCLGKMEDVSTKEGRTVLFVSHNMGAIEKLCKSAVLMKNGKIISEGKTKDVVDFYYKSIEESYDLDISLDKLPRKFGFGKELRFKNCCLQNIKGEEKPIFFIGEQIIIDFEIENRTKKDYKVHINVLINSSSNICVTTITSRSSYSEIEIKRNKIVNIQVKINNINLNPGNYNFSLFIGKRGILPYDAVDNVLLFTVIKKNNSKKAVYFDLPGIVQATSTWILK